MSQPVRQMLRPILHLRLDATAWKRGPPIIIVSIAATVPTQAAPMTVSLAFFIRVGIGCKSFTCAVDDCGDDNDRHEVPWIGLGANTTTNASRKADKAYTNGANRRLLPGTKNADPRYAWGALLGHGYHRTRRPWLATEVSGRDIDGGRRLLVRDTDRHLRHVAANFYLSRIAYSAVGPL